MRQCARCGFDFEPPTPDDTETNVCGSCADDLRQEEDAIELSIWVQTEEAEQAHLAEG